MSYEILTFLSVILFACVHLFAEKTRQFNTLPHERFLSICGGVAISYVFIDILPKLCESDLIVHQVLSGAFPFIEKHVYIMALAGFLLFFNVDKASSLIHKKKAFWLSLSCYALFNFLVGYAIVDRNNPEVQPLALFTFAIALHYFTNDYTLSEEHGQEYNKTGRWILIVSLFLGWLAGAWFQLPLSAVALISAFIGGGVIMNVTRHELPKEKPNSSGAFFLSATAYTLILLSIG